MTNSVFAVVYFFGLFFIGLFPLIAGFCYVALQTARKMKIDWNHVVFMIVLQICWFFGFMAYIMKFILGL